MKIIVSGGLGYIGSHTVIELINNGYTPIIIDNLSNSEEVMLDKLHKITGKKVDFHLIDSRNADGLDKVIKKYDKIDGIIHFAAFKAVNESLSNPIMYYDNNLNSLMRVLESMVNNNISSLVFSSSCTVYGQPDILPVDETTPFKTAWSPYGHTKQISEDIIKYFIESGKNIKAIALRYFNPVGAHSSGLIGELPKGVPNNLMPYLTQTVVGIREKLFVFGNDYDTHDGTAVRDYIHVSDLADAHISALNYLDKKENSHYDVFNVGTGIGYSVLDVINSAQKFVEQKINYEIVGRRAGDAEKIWASPEKVNKELGWYPKFNLDDMTRTSIEWEMNYRGEL